ncbi:MAG: PKD domain-containing protein [Mucilaginibacter sp.]
MGELISIGVKSIKRGPIPDDGTMGTVLTRLGNTYKDSASLKEAKPTVFNVQVEEQDNPVKQFFTKAAKTLAFSLIDYTPDTIQLVKGGTVVGGAWQEADNAVLIEECYQIITQTDLLIEIPRGSVAAVFNADLKKGAAALLDVEVTPLKPNGTDSNVPVTIVSQYKPPVVSAGADQPGVVAAVANLVGTATAYRGDISTIAWTCAVKPVGAAAPGITTPAALATGLTGLVSGVYQFKLTVTDENGYTNSDSMTMTVAIAPL